MAITMYSGSWCLNFKNEEKDLLQIISKICESKDPPQRNIGYMSAF